MSEKKFWNRNEVFSLIYQWELYPELWDFKSKCYRNRIKKQNALKNLAAKFNTTENEISRKLHNMRTQFHHELRREQAKNGVNGDEAYQRSWEYFDAMKFIYSHKNILKYETLTKKEFDPLDPENCDSVDKDAGFDLQEKAMNWTVENPFAMDYDDLLNKAVDIINKPADEFQVFGDFVAIELRNLRSQEHQHQLKLVIQRAIIQYSEMDVRETNSSTSGEYSNS